MVDFSKYDAVTHPLILAVSDYNNIYDHAHDKPVSYIIRINAGEHEAILGGGPSGAGNLVFGGASDVGGIDGANADEVILACIDALGAGGGTIFLKAGTYEFDVSAVSYVSVLVTPNISIVGEGVDSTIIKAVGTMQDLGSWLIQLQADCQLKDMTIDLNDGGLAWLGAYTPNSWYGGVLVGRYGAGIIDEPATNALVKNVKFINAGSPGVGNIHGIGVNLLYGTGATVRDCSFYDNKVGIFITYQPGIAGSKTQLAKTMYNVDGIYGKDNTEIIYWEIGSAHVSNVNGVDNVRGIYVNATDTWVTEGIINNVTLYDCTAAAISLGIGGAPQWFKASNIYINGAGTHGIVLNGEIGTVVSDFQLSNITVDGSTNSGIYMGNGGKISFSGITSQNNGNYGLYLEDINGNLTGLDVSDNGFAGVYLANTTDVNLTNSRTYNVAPATQPHGITIDGCDNTTVTGCRSFGHAAGDGILELGATDYSNLHDNNVLDNLNGIVIAGANTKVRNNLGFVTENNVLSPQFAIDAIAAVVVNIPHGLDVNPDPKDCQITVVEDTAVNDWEYGFVKVVSAGVPNVTCTVNVTNDSATGAAKAKLMLHVEAGG